MSGCLMLGRRVVQDTLMIGKWKKWRACSKKLHPLVLNRDVEDVLSWKNSKNDFFFLLDRSNAPSQ